MILFPPHLHIDKVSLPTPSWLLAVQRKLLTVEFPLYLKGLYPAPDKKLGSRQGTGDMASTNPPKAQSPCDVTFLKLSYLHDPGFILKGICRNVVFIELGTVVFKREYKCAWRKL